MVEVVVGWGEGLKESTEQWHWPSLPAQHSHHGQTLCSYVRKSN